MLAVVADDRMASWYIASAPFAKYYCLPPEQKGKRAAAELIQLIETTAENMNQYHTQRSTWNQRNRNQRQNDLYLTQEQDREPCLKCNKMHAGNLAQCWLNAQEVLAEKEAKGRGRGRGRPQNGEKEQQHLTQEPPGKRQNNRSQAPTKRLADPNENKNYHLAEAIQILLAKRETMLTR